MSTGSEIIRRRQTTHDRNGKKEEHPITEEKGSKKELPIKLVETKKQDYIRIFYVYWWTRQDVGLWILGLIFIALLVVLVFVMGDVREWNALSGYIHNTTQSSQDRFLPEPYQAEVGVRGRYGPDAPARWYYWKLKPELITFWTRFFPWSGYLAHQLLMWGVIYYNQNLKNKVDASLRFTASISYFNVVALVGNMLFHLLHLVNTHVTYDALAQDVSIASSQSSVVVILIFIILMEYPDRGLLFGWPTASHTSRASRFLLWNPGPSALIRKYHGYAYAWAAVFTFWYHPMENTWGHVTGAIYTWLILLQGSLLYTKLHLNIYWRQLLEAWVVLHGGVVAAQTGGPELMGTRLWPMFTFGFAMTWILTEIFGLPLWKRLPAIARLIPFSILMAVIIWAYSWIPDRNGRRWVRMFEVIRLPATMYLYFAIAWLSGRLFLASKSLIERMNTVLFGVDKKRTKYFMLSSAILVYVGHIGLAMWAEYGDLKMRLTAIGLIFDAIFIFGCTMSFIFLHIADNV